MAWQWPWVAGQALGRRPHTVKGPEIGRHPNTCPAGEWCLDSGGESKRGWSLVGPVSTKVFVKIPRMRDTHCGRGHRQSLAMRFTSTFKSAWFIAMSNGAIDSIRTASNAILLSRIPPRYVARCCGINYGIPLRSLWSTYAASTVSRQDNRCPRGRRSQGSQWCATRLSVR